jgi:hypothetical protein
MNAEAPAAAGHNSGMVDLEILPDQLGLDHAELVKRKNELAEAGDKWRETEISDDATLARCSDFLKQVTLHVKDADAARGTAKSPFLNASRIVDNWFAAITAPLTATKLTLLERMTAYQRRREAEIRQKAIQDAQKKREEEEFLRKQAEKQAAKAVTPVQEQRVIATEAAAVSAQAEAEAAERVAVAAPSKLTQTRGSYGSSASLRQTLAFRVTDLSKVPRAYLLLNDAAVKAHMKTAQKGELPPNIDGIEFYFDTKTVVR